MNTYRFPGEFGSGDLGSLIENGTGQTSAQGTLSLVLPEIPESEIGQIVTLEVSTQDESGLPVSARTEMRVHPADFYIGLRPDQWFGRADRPMGFEVYTVDWAKNPSGAEELTARFQQVRWEKETDVNGFPTYTPVYTPVSSSDFVTGADGKARLSFVPPTAGNYMLDVSGGGAHTQTLIWVAGAGSAAWPEPPDQRLEIIADRDAYKAGDTARVFIPNPFATSALAPERQRQRILRRAHRSGRAQCICQCDGARAGQRLSIWSGQPAGGARGAVPERAGDIEPGCSGTA
jgi:uncharacterized protein YfaS (alpha-2-macroglobulin family)